MVSGKAATARNAGFLVSVLVFLAACSSTGDVGSYDFKTTVYNCDRGAQVRVQYLESEGTAIVTRGEDTYELPQQSVVSGFAYGNGAINVHGEGEELMLDVGRMATVHCTQQ